MAIPRRHAHPANISAGLRTFFVTSSIADKRLLLQSTRSASLFLEVLAHYRREGRYRLHEFVVMRDHFHILLSVDLHLSIERAVQFIKGGFAYRAGKGLGFHPPVWQKGFSEVRVRDGDAFVRYRNYIHNNPVTRGLVQTAEEFPFSSACASARMTLDPPPQGLKPILFGRSDGTAEAIP